MSNPELEPASNLLDVGRITQLHLIFGVVCTVRSYDHAKRELTCVERMTRIIPVAQYEHPDIEAYLIPGARIVIYEVVRGYGISALMSNYDLKLLLHV